MPTYVFVSYSRSDGAYVLRLVPYLRRAGIDVWIDDDIDYGTRWETVVRDHLDRCGVFLPVMTPASEDSPWVAREILRAEARDKQIVPLLLAGHPFFRLADLQYEDVRSQAMPGDGFLRRLRTLTRTGVDTWNGSSPAAEVGVRATPRLGTPATDTYEIVTIHPTNFGEARTIGETFLAGHPVVLVLTDLAESDAKRIVDFSAGLVFGQRGTVERLTNRIFLLTPSNVMVTADDKARIAEGRSS